MQQPKRSANAVFQGGGVTGIGLAGAYSVIDQHYQLQHVAGTSAGAIMAALVASGHTAAEIQRIITDLPFDRMMDLSLLDRLLKPLALPLHLLRDLGIFRGQFLEDTMRGYLTSKAVKTFGDLRDDGSDDPRFRYRLRMVATDLSQGSLLVLPEGIAAYGQDPDRLEIARAVRMSMSIPFFFRAVRLPNPGRPASVVVDGGVLSGFPLWLYDDGQGPPPLPTFGFMLVNAPTDAQHPLWPATPERNPISGPVSLYKAMANTAMNARDAYYLTDDRFAQTITIDTSGVSPTDFNLDAAAKQRLLASGVAAAQEFLRHWDEDLFLRTFRSGQPAVSRRQRVMPVQAPVSPA